MSCKRLAVFERRSERFLPRLESFPSAHNLPKLWGSESSELSDCQRNQWLLWLALDFFVEGVSFDGDPVDFFDEFDHV